MIRLRRLRARIATWLAEVARDDSALSSRPESQHGLGSVEYTAPSLRIRTLEGPKGP